MMIVTAVAAVTLGLVRFMDPAFNRANSKIAALCIVANSAFLYGTLTLIVRRSSGSRFENLFLIWLFFALLSGPILLIIVWILLAVPIPLSILG